MQPARRSNEERREHSIQQVLAAALRLFVSKGYENATIDTIAAEAGLTKGAVYFYFKGKAALLHALLDDAEELYADIFTQLKTSGASPAAAVHRTPCRQMHAAQQCSDSSPAPGPTGRRSRPRESPL